MSNTESFLFKNPAVQVTGIDTMNGEDFELTIMFGMPGILLTVELIDWELGAIPFLPANNTVMNDFSAESRSSGVGFRTIRGTSTGGLRGGSQPAVPEPGKALLLETGLQGLAGYRWQQRHRDQSKSNGLPSFSYSPRQESCLAVLLKIKAFQ